MFVKAREKKLEDERCRRQKFNKNLKNTKIYLKNIDREYKKLTTELFALQQESAWTLKYGTGDQNLWCRVQDHLNKIALFFNGHLEKVNTTECIQSLENKTSVMEHLQALFEKSTVKMDEWVTMVENTTR